MVDDATLDSLWDYLWWHHRGRHKAVKSSFLRRHFNLSNRELIEATRTLNIERRKPVCSSTKGEYRGIFAARSPAELADYAADLKKRSMGIFERMAAINKILAAFEG